MIRFLINIYIYIIIADAIFSYLPQLRANQFVRYIKQAADYSLRPVRKLLPEDMPFDISPIVVILVLNLIKILW